jgi:hypothetical protein
MCVDPTQQIGDSNFTDTDVLAVASQLLQQSGTTTTLDVKNLLRDGGFRAFQVDVSLAMDRLAIQENWNWTFNGTFRVFEQPIGLSDDEADNDVSTGTLIVIRSVPAQPLPDPIPVVYTASPEDGDWQVFDYQNRQPVVHVKQGVSRNAARNWYSTVYGTEYIDVAANVYNAS